MKRLESALKFYVAAAIAAFTLALIEDTLYVMRHLASLAGRMMGW